MCMGCVEDGRMTQEDLDRRVMAGETRVLPFTDLTPRLFAQALNEVMNESIREGWPLFIVLEFVATTIEDYCEAHPESSRAEIVNLMEAIGV